jgi:4-hydroxybenzoate polyprenyltransferase
VVFMYLRKFRFEEDFKYSSFVLMFVFFSLLGNQTVAFLRFSNYLILFYVLLIAEVYQYILKRISFPLMSGLFFSLLISFSFIYSMLKPLPNTPYIFAYSRYYPYMSIISKEKDADREKYSEQEYQ